MTKNKWFLNGSRGSGRTIRLLCETYENKIADLEKENAELNETLGKCAKTPVLYCLGAKETITKAKEIIRALLKHTYGQNLNTQNDFDLYLGRIKEAEQFLSEVEK